LYDGHSSDALYSNDHDWMLFLLQWAAIQDNEGLGTNCVVLDWISVCFAVDFPYAELILGYPHVAMGAG